tara:strand:+ start:166 stop:558 length:393 start_codon:yes stop_codon:yes gene_type:complete
MKTLLTIILFCSSNVLFAGCGGCEIKNQLIEGKKSSSFISNVPSNGKIEGFVIASCNKCNLGKKNDKKCSMGIQVGEKTLRLKNDSHDHHAAHDADGICNSLRIAYVEGSITTNYFDALLFKLIDSPIQN